MFCQHAIENDGPFISISIKLVYPELLSLLWLWIQNSSCLLSTTINHQWQCQCRYSRTSSKGMCVCVYKLYWDVNPWHMLTYGYKHRDRFHWNYTQWSLPLHCALVLIMIVTWIVTLTVPINFNDNSIWTRYTLR